MNDKDFGKKKQHDILLYQQCGKVGAKVAIACHFKRAVTARDVKMSHWFTSMLKYIFRVILHA